MGAGNKYELRTAIPPPAPTPPAVPSPESEYESEYESEEEEEKSPSPPPPARTPTPPPPQCEMCGLLLTENCLRHDMSSASVLEILKEKLLAPLCVWSARASFGEERHQGGSSQRPHRRHRWHKDKDCIHIFQFTLRTSGKSEDIWFESDEALILIDSSYDILSTPQGIFIILA